MIESVLRRLPVPVITALGRWQYRIPPLRWLTRRYTERMTGQTGIIARGLGAGLRFDCTGGFPGYLLGTTEIAEQQALGHHLKDGGVFYDIGANIGFYSTIAGRVVGRTGHVYALEPDPVAARQADRNAALNAFPNVTTVQVAASDTDGVTRMEFTSEGSAHNRLSPDGDGIEVAAVTIDRWRAETDARPPTVVMIDVEGAEVAVLNGMLRTIREYKPAILCEVHWIGPEFGEFVDRELRPLGYALSPLPGEKAVELTRWHAVLVAS